MSNSKQKKNPFVSMSQSAVNRTASTISDQATAQAKRQISAAVTKATDDNLKAMVGATTPASPKAKPKKPRS